MMSHIMNIRQMMPMECRIQGSRAALRLMLCFSFLISCFSFSAAQIKIAGSVYGGGNQGQTGGNSIVTAYSGDIDSIFGGARMADVAGHAFVHLDGENALVEENSNYLLINYVFGGNDISGNIGKSATLPTVLEHTSDNQITADWNAFVRISSKTNSDGTAATGNQKIYVGQLFAGGNGDYYYHKVGNEYNVYDSEETYTTDPTAFFATTKTAKPTIDKTYLEIVGGSIVYAYGGGNDATVNDRTVIYVNNPSEVVNSIKEGTKELLTADRLVDEMGLNTTFSNPTSDEYQIGSFFGGNNKAAMAIRPTWNLQKGLIRNVYSGGNEGKMTSPDGLLLEINPTNDDDLVIGTVYGGCRKADVEPQYANGTPMESVNNLTDKDENNNLKYHFPDGFAARTLIHGGRIQNVYGGNDISGNVKFGCALGIYANVTGNIYGGGNGSYPYTDNDRLLKNPLYRDLYYDPGSNSVEALNNFRPNAEQVSLRVWGTVDDPTIIGGAIYVGGNSASLKPTGSRNKAELKIGSNVYADRVFLGNNGENMVKYNEVELGENGIDVLKQEGILRTYTKYVDEDGNLHDTSGEGYTKFNSIKMEGTDNKFAEYMAGCAMENHPSVVFDDMAKNDPDTYDPNHPSYFGSFYCGGNVGSMTKAGKVTIDFDYPVVIFEKLVGGCNNAFVPAVEGFNAQYVGGVIGSPDDPSISTDDGNKDKLVLNLSGLRIEPKRWKDPLPLTDPLEWNTWIGDQKNNIDPATAPIGTVTVDDDGNEPDDMKRRFKNGNIYGGCCESGVVNGNVIINVNSTVMDRSTLFDEVDTSGEESLYGADLLTQEEYTITERHTGVLLGQQGMDVLGTALNLFGGGKGAATEIWGSTTINLNKGYIFQVFGGSEEGAIGKSREFAGETVLNTDYSFTYTPDETLPSETETKHFVYSDDYSCYVNLKGEMAGASKADETTYNEKMPDSEFLYGGGFMGPIAGNTVVSLGNGRIFNSFAGSCYADILGHTETYVGYQHTYTDENDDVITVDGFPWVRDIVYGGNDLGGKIIGKKDFSDRVVNGNGVTLHSANVTTASAYVEYNQGRTDAIFGGHFGTYDYADEYSAYASRKPYLDNAFVNFRPANNNVSKGNYIGKVYGGSQGQPGDFDSNSMQERSYVLIDIPEKYTDNNPIETYKNMEVFGAGSWGGLGMKTLVASDATDANRDKVSAIIDLARGQIGAAYGGSLYEGFTRRTVVNVPSGSTIKLNSIFGGAYGEENGTICDVYEANVEYHSEDARISYLYGGNNHARRTLYGRVNIDVKAWTNPASTWLATVYGAGYGEDTWSQYTEVNLKGKKDEEGEIIGGAKVYQVYGGGYNGRVMNSQTVSLWAAEDDKQYPLNMGVYTDNGLDDELVKTTELGDKCNTNVRIYMGATIGHDPITKGGYGYGGGQGTKNIPQSGDVNGTTYIALLGGTAYRDIYAAGSVGAVLDEYGTEIPEGQRFKATANAYIAGGSVRNVYGGGYMGCVGLHEDENGQRIGEISGETTDDIDGKTNVVIGILEKQPTASKLAAVKAVLGNSATLADYGFYAGVPTVQRNAYGGGEGETAEGGRGGAVFGEANLTIRNGYVGYVHLLDNQIQDNQGNIVETSSTGKGERYEAKVDDETKFDETDNTKWIGKGTLEDYGCLFGGGYSDKSNVDFTNVTIWGGMMRGSVHGGAEVAAIGRGKVIEAIENGKPKRTLQTIYKAGGTKVTMYYGHVLRNVFGGGKGYNVQGYGGANNLYTDGYVFGTTEVYIHGGSVGTAEGVAIDENGKGGYGNVFGGGDVGYVYSKGYFSDGTKAKEGTTSPNHIYYYDDEGHLTQDCKVVISPYLQVKENVTPFEYDGTTYGPYDYVPTDYLNTLPKKDKSTGFAGTDWENLYTGANKNVATATDDKEERGVIIHNAVFAGGNVSSNSDQTYANATTVFGNATATLYDAYHRDFITVGTEHTGGLYGGGNLSVVDGYRELNITNYGTDYYGLDQQIEYSVYETLSNRERAYFQLLYLCQTTFSIGDKTYTEGVTKLTEDEYNALDDSYKANFVQYGFCSIYAGRLLNTIQRADLCGVFGSRLVLQGAKDRVAEVGDATVYTINRVGELSLNKQNSVITTGDNADTGDDAVHGNYFGIYSLVNYLGNLTSDVLFTDPYKRWDKTNKVAVVDDPNKSFYDWKVDRLKYRDRNNGTCHNQVALASGVHLELTTENSTPARKDWGLITGIVELDLINVKKEIEGGGYVYAKNQHGARQEESHENKILSEYNMAKTGVHAEARTYKFYTYPGALKELETSGNFIHKTKRIVDDCYPHNGVYNDGYVESPAHYWFIKGEVYIYDQVVSAYAGSATSYSKSVNLPLTITAGSNGKLKLLNVKPNLYAYYADKDHTSIIGQDGVKVDNESATYYLNDVITWWDWNMLSTDEQKYFVQETFVNVEDCTIDGTSWAAGTYVLPAQPTTSTFSGVTVLDKKGQEVTDDAGIKNLFRSSNNISHDTGYVLTFDMDSPKVWDDWYTLIKTPTDPDIAKKITKDAYIVSTDQDDYRVGPTFTLNTSPGLYGQRWYNEGEVITEEVYNDYTKTTEGHDLSGNGKQASFEQAKVGTDNALVCVNTIRLGEDEYVLQGELVANTPTKLEELATKYRAYNNSLTNTDPVTLEQALDYIHDNMANAYVCTDEGNYGGQYFNTGENYSAIKAWCSLTDDRTKFDFNYDALDLLIDPQYTNAEGEKYQYDGKTSYVEGHDAEYIYSLEKPVEYTATYLGTGTLTYENEDGTSGSIASGGSLDREVFEKIKNEQRHYTLINVDAATTESTTMPVYIVLQNFIDKGTPYAKGQDLSEKTFSTLSEEYKTATYIKQDEIDKQSTATTVYYCFETYDSSDPNKTLGAKIDYTTYSTSLKNYQKEFSIQGKEPTETTTLYVSRESNIKDLTTEKIITVVYQYTYYENDDEGDGVSVVNELHVVNIHLQLESGVPEIGPLAAPSVVLPGTSVGLTAPTVNPGLYDPIGNGWEIFTSEDDALLGRNGEPFANRKTPVYWYQNQKAWVAFYTKTYLGKYYSNPVVISVANYHDLADVLADTEHYMYIDHEDANKERDPKIYINDYTSDDPAQNGLDLLQDLFTKSTDGSTLNTAQVGGCKNLEFILRTDINHSGEWNGIGTDTYCFDGIFHGDGHTISGLPSSLFSNLCGDVYNLGVTGSFTTAGIADNGYGYLENCWVKSSNNTSKTAKPVFDNPTNKTPVGEETVRTVHMVNCYYPEENQYTDHADDATYGLPTEKPLKAFYNGEVTYDLNEFYLFKRYCDNTVTSGNDYVYLTDDGGETLTQNTGYYADKNGPYLMNDAKGNYVGSYVESRYVDGDFIYASGELPGLAGGRLYTDAQDKVHYAPIWPDDYIFFGQTLTYGHDEDRDHQEEPKVIIKYEGRLITPEVGELQNISSNRVYRAPAYFGNSKMDVAHFNPNAIFAKTKKDDETFEAYKGMTAIDFSGGNGDVTGNATDYQYGTVAATESQSAKFYPPLLDDEGLTDFTNVDLTRNLLVYTRSITTGSATTENIVQGKLTDEAFVDKRPADYHTVGEAENLRQKKTVKGHWVKKSGDTYTATRDHFLVDKEDFNAPIAYTFTDGTGETSACRMWYQRIPDNYVGRKKTDGTFIPNGAGWEGISLPFVAELVTTNTKGEITHFYNQGDNWKGHEYWLREYRGQKTGTSVTDDGIFTADFQKPEPGTTTKDYDNTFLWDYYYSKTNREDQNIDQYPDASYKYYSESRTYTNYPRLANGKPYIIGFPGERYYEFDLSGNFEAKTARVTPNKLDAQIITFASATGATIGVSDTELANAKNAVSDGGSSADGYTFVPNYASETIKSNYSEVIDAVTYKSRAYILNEKVAETDNESGSSYDVKRSTATTLQAVPFRPYFMTTTDVPSAREKTRSIVFSDEETQLKGDDERDLSDEEYGSLNVYAKRKKIVVESNLHETAEVRIVNTAGITVNAFYIEPGETVETRINNAGVYIVQSTDGRHTKKLVVK